MVVAHSRQPGLAIYEPENEADARGVEAMLRDEGIDCLVLPYGDTAYPGIVDRGRPWGVIKVPETQAGRARVLVDGWREASPEDLELAFARAPVEAGTSASANGRRALVVVLLLALLLALGLQLSR